MIYQIYFKNAIGRIRTNNKALVIDSCNIFKFVEGKHILIVCKWVYKNKGKIYPSKGIIYNV
jgi:ribosomal protein S24E